MTARTHGRASYPDTHLIAATRALLEHIETYDIPYPDAICSPAMPENPRSLMVRVNPLEYPAWLESMIVDDEENTPHPNAPGIVRTLFHGRTSDQGIRLTVHVFRPAPVTLPLRVVS